MASRLNRKKKGRANQQNRERTVTTLTEDPSTQFLVPTPSEEPAGANMSSPFSISSSSGGGTNNNAPNVPNGTYQTPGNFGYQGPYPNGNDNYMEAGQQQPYIPQVTMPLGKDDYERLENLKAMIKSGQHDRYQPIPKPIPLLDVYQEGLAQSVALAQQLVSYAGAGYNEGSYDVGSAVSDLATKSTLPSDSTRRLPRIQTKDASDQSGNRRAVDTFSQSGPQGKINVPSPLNTALSCGSTDILLFCRVIKPPHQQIDMVLIKPTTSHRLLYLSQATIH